jgi:hypothetical protein
MLEQMHHDVSEILEETSMEVNLSAAFLHMVKSASLVIDVLLEPS